MSLTELPNHKTASLDFLSGGGEMGERIRNFDWSKTPVGPPEQWEQSLKTCVRIMLTSPQPMFVWWGKELINIYNDAYRFVLGEKHPLALGASGNKVWKEIWPEIGTRADIVFNENEGTYDEGLLLIMNRHGYDEETYFKFSYNPIPGERGGTSGLFCVCTEETSRIINERYLNTLRELDILSRKKTEQEIYADVATVLSANNRDIPFGIIYKINEQEKVAGAIGFFGIEPGQKIFPVRIDLTRPTNDTANFCRAYSSKEIFVSANASRRKHLPKGFWQIEPTHFIHIPILIPGNENPVAVLSAALNPYRKFDSNYKQFTQLIADRIAIEINNVLNYELEKKKATELAELDKAKTIFFSNISHEFRTPLTLMLGTIEEALKDPDTIMKNSGRLQVTHRNAMRLLKLVNTLLDFSRIESGRQKAIYALTDIASLTKDLASNFRAIIEKAGLRFVVKADTIIQPVYVDRQMWEKIVFNLLSNAFKYTLEGKIELRLYAEESNLVLEVEDTGAGIPEHELPNMFKRFHRVEKVTGRTYDGTGIGLSLTKELVLLHGGNIDVESSEGKGSTFIVTIPLGKDHLPREQSFELPDKLEDIISDVFIEEAASFINDGTTSQTAQKTNGLLPTILVVDDNADMQHHISSLLENQFNVITAGNGVEALKKIRNDKPLLVISDVMMPVMDGIELLKEIKDKRETENIPVILLTARAGEESTIEGYKTGADDYLVKPFSARELKARIDAQIRIWRKRNEASQSIYRLFDEVPFAVAVLKGENLVIDYINKYNLDIWKTSKEDVAGKPLFEVRPDIRQSIESIHKQVYESGKRFKADEVPVHFNSGGIEQTRYFDAIIDPMFDETGKIIGQVATSIEVTDKVLARTKIEKSENRFRTVLQHSPGIFIILEGPEMVIRFGNQALFESWGKSADIINKPLLKVLPELKDQPFPKLLKKVYETGREHIGREEKATIFKDGKPAEVYYDYVYQPITEPDGSISGITVMASDITDQVEARRKVQENEEQLQLITNAVPSLISYIDKDLCYQYNNKRYEDWFGIAASEIKGRSIKEVLGEKAFNAIAPYVKRVLAGEKVTFETVAPYKSGGQRNIWATYVPRTDKQTNEILGFYVLVNDITERKKEEEKLKESEERNRLFVESAPAAMAMFDKEMKYISVSKQWLKEYELSGDVIGKRHYDLFPNILQRWKDVHTRCLQGVGERSDEDFYVKDNGEEVWLNWAVHPWYNASNEIGGIVIFTENITERKKAKEVIRESEARFRFLFESNIMGIAFWNIDGGVYDANEAFLRVIGYTRQDMENGLVNWRKFTRPEDASIHEAKVQDAIGGRTIDPYETVFIHKQGYQFSTLVGYAMLTGSKENGIAFLQDFSEIKRVQKAVLESEERFRAMANEAPLFVWETDEQLQTTFLNKAGLDYFNLDGSIKMTSLSWKKFIHPDDIDRVLNIMNEAAGLQQSYTLEMRLRNGATNQYRWFLDKGAPRYMNDRFIGFIGTSLDIHERKETEKELEDKVKERTSELAGQNILLQKQNDLVKKIFDTSVDAIAVYDTDMRVITLNQASLDILGKPAEEVIGKKLLELIPQMKGSKGYIDLSKAIEGEVIHNKIYRLGISDKYYENFLLPLKDENEKVYAVLAIAHDNTDLIESAKKLNDAQQIAQFGSWEWDVVTGQLAWSDNMFNIYGISANNGIDFEKFMSLVHPEDRESMQANINAAFHSQKFDDFFHRIITPAGEEKIMHARGEVITDTEGRIVRMVGTGQDVTRQKLIEQELIATSKKIEERNQFIEQLINSSLDLIMVIDKDHRLITLNRKAQLIYKEFYKEDLIGKKINEINPPLKGTEFFNDISQAFSGKVIKKDKVKSTISNRYFEHNYIPLTEPNGEVYAVMIISHEITESVRQMEELRKLYESDEQKNNFIAMASHELKTPITSIKGYVQLLLNALEKEKDEKKALPPLLVRSSLISVDKQIKRLTRLISELLDISKIEKGTLELRKEKFSLNELAIETIEDILYTNTKHQINLYHDFYGHVDGDKDRIGQVMINFLTNAIKYSPDSDKIDVSIGKNSNDHISFKVTDYGIGIDKKEQQRIFDKFYRAKGKAEQTYPGFGIGLFIANEFIQKHGGQVWVESEKGSGSTFIFTLPLLKEQ